MFRSEGDTDVEGLIRENSQDGWVLRMLHNTLTHSRHITEAVAMAILTRMGQIGLRHAQNKEILAGVANKAKSE